MIELSKLGGLSFYIILGLVIETKLSDFLGKKGVILLFWFLLMKLMISSRE